MKRSEDWTPQEVLVFCREKNVKAVEFRYADLLGAMRRVAVPVSRFDVELFETGFAVGDWELDGKDDDAGDVVIVPQPERAYVDPFSEAPTLIVVCNVQDPVTGEDHARDPRSLAERARNYLVATGVADGVSVATETDFYLFDDVRFGSRADASYAFLDRAVAGRRRGRDEIRDALESDSPDAGSSPRNVDLHDDILSSLLECGLDVDSQRRARTPGGGMRVDLRLDDIVAAADATMTLKHVVKRVARNHGKTATFMPMPLLGEPGCGMRTQLSLSKEGQPVLPGSGYGGLSEQGLHAIGGLLKHAPALLAFCAPTTNSYKRLAVGAPEAPIELGFSSRRRTTVCRVPLGRQSPKAKRIEFRPSDPSANPYLAFAAILMAAIDGIQNKIHPGRPLDRDDLEDGDESPGDAPPLPTSLDEALRALEDDRDFLMRGDVFTDDLIGTWIARKREREIAPLRLRPHPHEFATYFDV